MGLGPEGLGCSMFMNLARRPDRYWFAVGCHEWRGNYGIRPRNDSEYGT